MTFTDPAIFVAPVTFTKHWIWFPDAAVNSYECLIAAED